MPENNKKIRSRGAIALLTAAGLLLAASAIGGTYLLLTRNSGSDDQTALATSECQRSLGHTATSEQDRAFLANCIASATSNPGGSTSPSATRTVGPTATKTATPTPKASTPPQNYVKGPCPAFPAFPDASCTGWQHTGVKLKTCSEGDGENDGHLTKANAVYSGCLFKGNQSFLRIRAKNIIIKNSRIEGAIAPHYLTPGDYMGLKIIDVEITTAVPDSAPISDGSNFSCLRCHVHHASTGIGGGNNVQIIDSYVHDMTYSEGAHQAAVGMNHGVGIKIIHNNLDCRRWNVPPGPQGCSSALSLYDEGKMDGVLVQNNLLNAAGEYCAYSGGPTAKNVQFIDNRFGQKYHPQCGNAGPLHSWYPNNTGYVWRGNTFTNGKVANP